MSYWKYSTVSMDKLADVIQINLLIRHGGDEVIDLITPDK